MVRLAAHVIAVLALSATLLALHAAPDPAPRLAHPPRPTRQLSPMRLSATAYCHSGKTAAGTGTHTGIVAADPRLLPVGSVLRILEPRSFAGIYTVMDTGSAIKGRELDIFIPNCTRAVEFGRQSVRVTVLRRGWDPKTGADSDR